jgi:UrcA family protein
MNTAKRARLAAIPLAELNLASQSGQREFRRRMRRKAGEIGNSWQQQTGKPVNKPRCLRNTPGWKQRWRWVPKQ